MTKNQHSSPLIWDSRSVSCSLIKTCVCSKKHTQHLSIKPKWLQTHRGYLNLYYFSPCDSLVRAGLLPLPPTSLLEDLNNSCYLRYLCIRLFMKAQMCMCRAAAWEANEDIRWVQGSERGDFFYCNSVMKLDSVRVVVSQKTMTDACCTATEGTEEGLFCFCLCSWLTGCQPHFVTSSPEQ